MIQINDFLNADTQTILFPLYLLSIVGLPCVVRFRCAAMIPKLLMGGGGGGKHTPGSSYSIPSILDSLVCLKTSTQPQGSCFQLEAQRADTVCVYVLD